MKILLSLWMVEKGKHSDRLPSVIPSPGIDYKSTARASVKATGCGDSPVKKPKLTLAAICFMVASCLMFRFWHNFRGPSLCPLLVVSSGFCWASKIWLDLIKNIITSREYQSWCRVKWSSGISLLCPVWFVWFCHYCCNV